MTIGTKEWADQNINFQSGCRANCEYCYARLMADKFGWKKWADWSNPVIRRKDVCKAYRKRKGRIMFPSSHNLDLWNIHEGIKVLKKLTDAGNQVLVVCKPQRIVVDRIIRLIPKTDKIEFRFTITTNSPDQLNTFEPQAPSFMDRWNSIYRAHQAGIKTSVSIEPFLDSDPVDLIIELIEERGVEPQNIWLGPMNHLNQLTKLSEPIRKNLDWLKRIYSPNHLKHIYNQILLEKLKINYKDGFLKQMNKR